MISSVDFWTWMLFAFCAGVVTMWAGVHFIVNKPDVTVYKDKATYVFAFALVALVLAANVSPAAAQTAVPLEIPTDVIFTETNTWISTFAPIAAIGIGITVALAVLGYLGKMIASAFKR